MEDGETVKISVQSAERLTPRRHGLAPLVAGTLAGSAPQTSNHKYDLISPLSLKLEEFVAAPVEGNGGAVALRTVPPSEMGCERRMPFTTRLCLCGTPPPPRECSGALELPPPQSSRGPAGVMGAEHARPDTDMELIGSKCYLKKGFILPASTCPSRWRKSLASTWSDGATPATRQSRKPPILRDQAPAFKVRTCQNLTAISAPSQ